VRARELVSEDRITIPYRTEVHVSERLDAAGA
jgi:hypothetical protein